MRRPFAASGLAIALVALAGCSQAEPPPAADDPLFRGLDPAVVAETLASPRAAEFVKGADADATRTYYQGMVRSTIDCRAYLRAYETWMTTGTSPGLPPAAQPAEPDPAVDSDKNLEREQLKPLFDNGDPASLRSWFGAEGSCGKWVPATPKDYSGKTVADVAAAPV